MPVFWPKQDLSQASGHILNGLLLDVLASIFSPR
jgi:hypothetical protein